MDGVVEVEGLVGPVVGVAQFAAQLAVAGVALDRVEADAQTPGACEQADALVKEVMDLLPPFPGGGGAFALAQRRAERAPARGVRAGLFEGCFGQAVPEVPAVAGLHDRRVGVGRRVCPRAAAGRTCSGTRRARRSLRGLFRPGRA
ncbi:hypothetical protein, partial [Streptomyces flaveolus]